MRRRWIPCDFGLQGELGAVPGWPGAEVLPAQPMVSQTRAVLDAYRRAGGPYHEEVLPDCGHAPHVEKEDETFALVTAFLESAGS